MSNIGMRSLDAPGDKGDAVSRRDKARDEADAEAYSLYAAGRREERNAVAGRKCAAGTVEGVGVGL